jgi:hypothetical protein
MSSCCVVFEIIGLHHLYSQEKSFASLPQDHEHIPISFKLDSYVLPLAGNNLPQVLNFGPYVDMHKNEIEYMFVFTVCGKNESRMRLTKKSKMHTFI